MGDAIVKLILKDLNELVVQEVKFLIRVRPQLESLHTQLRLISSFLRAFDSRNGTNEKNVTDWVAELRDAAYEAEDIILECSQKIDQEKRLGITGSLINFILCVSETMARHHLGDQIENLTTKINSLLAQQSPLGIKFEQVAETSSAVANNSPSELQKAAIAKGVDVVGFLNVENQMDELLQSQDQHTCISIVGMGGLGKTTITKKIYNKSEIESRFKCRAWITVSQRYKDDTLLRGILKGILDCIPRTNVEKQRIAKLDTAGLVFNLQQLLANVTYLVVVDDIWKCEAWDLINAALPDNSMGSKVILTTRNREVASYTQGTTIELPFLNEEESWVLFCKKAFPKTVCPPELADIGKEVVKRCRGLPLAIVVLGGMLSRKPPSSYEWKNIRDRLSHELNIH